MALDKICEIDTADYTRYYDSLNNQIVIALGRNAPIGLSEDLLKSGYTVVSKYYNLENAWIRKKDHVGVSRIKEIEISLNEYERRVTVK